MNIPLSDSMIASSIMPIFSSPETRLVTPNHRRRYRATRSAFTSLDMRDASAMPALLTATAPAISPPTFCASRSSTLMI